MERVHELCIVLACSSLLPAALATDPDLVKSIAAIQRRRRHPAVIDPVRGRGRGSFRACASSPSPDGVDTRPQLLSRRNDQSRKPDGSRKRAIENAAHARWTYEYWPTSHGMDSVVRRTGMGTMTDGPGFDPYEVLGVGVDADEIVVQLAYRARIREVHPDIAGADGLARAKRLNVARDWLLDPELRAQLARSWAGPLRPGDGPSPGRRATRARRARPPGAQDRTWSARRPGPSRLDPDVFDFGPRTPDLRMFFRAVRTLSRDERARVNYSLGEARPVRFEGYRDFVEPGLWSRSEALRDIVAVTWGRGMDEEPPFVSPIGRVLPTGYLVANAYAQWTLLGDFLRHELGSSTFRSEHFLDSFAARCRSPWEASIRQARYGPYDRRVRAFLATATSLPVGSAERLARSWQEHMGGHGLGDPAGDIGPGVWLPAPPNVPEVLKISGYLAAVDVSRIEPPHGLGGEHHDGFRYGLRLTAHAMALGLVDGSGRDYLRPWREAIGSDRSLRSRQGQRMPAS